MMRHTILLLVILSTWLPAAQAADLGRLFFTPEQRAQLDYAYARDADSDGSNNASVLTVNGIVQKDGGARTVWINGVAQAAGKSDAQNPESVPVSVPGKSKPMKIKVGQKLLLDTPSQ
ncbi:MAG: hypothetical protein GC139_06690 [Sideroxydans sp.]|nr:hypothetical protein [Sideroxydans sp.]